MLKILSLSHFIHQARKLDRKKRTKREIEGNDVISGGNVKSNQIEISKRKSHQIGDLRDFRITSIFIRIEERKE